MAQEGVYFFVVYFSCLFVIVYQH